MSSGSQQENGGHGGQAAEVRDRQNGTNKQPVKKTSTTSRNNGYRAKELAKIKNGLQPFEKAESPGVRTPVSSELGLRTVSSLSTESSTNSVCSTDGFTTSSSSNNNMVAAHQLHQQLNNPNSVCSTDGFSSVQDALSRLNQAGFDEVSQMEHFRFRVQHC